VKSGDEEDPATCSFSNGKKEETRGSPHLKGKKVCFPGAGAGQEQTSPQQKKEKGA